jgi:hypothetical protein
MTNRLEFFLEHLSRFFDVSYKIWHEHLIDVSYKIWHEHLT